MRVRLAIGAALLALAAGGWAQDDVDQAPPAGDVVPEQAPQNDAPLSPPTSESARPADSAEEALNRADAPQYRVKACCDLCPRAADPAAYTTSKYLEDSALLQQGKESWLFRSKTDLISKIDLSDESIGGLKHLVDTLHQVGTELVIVYQPPRGLADVDKLSPAQRKSYDFKAARQSYIAALARLRTSGAVVPPYEKLISEGKDYDYFFRRDHHWTPAGAEHTAQITAETVRSLPAFRGVPQKTFKTHLAGIISKPGSLQKIAQQICGGTYSMQFMPGYATEPEGGKGGGLLDEDVTPEITLVGTSNSDDRGGYNFGGYLEQYLQTDILNVAITGGSFEGSLLHYLPSEAFQKHPPKILIWEMPYQDFPGTAISPHRIFRQAVALVGNGCAGKDPSLSKTANLHAGSNEVLFNGGGKLLPIVGNKYVLDFQFSDPGVKEFHSTIWYMNGMRERLQLRFKQYVDNKGRFVAELRNDQPDYAQATFMGATVDLPDAPAKPMSVTAKVCPLDVSMTAANAKRGPTQAKAAPVEAPVSAMEATPAPKTKVAGPKPALPALAPKPSVPPVKSPGAAAAGPARKSAKSTDGRTPAVTYSTGKAEGLPPKPKPEPKAAPEKPASAPAAAARKPTPVAKKKPAPRKATPPSTPSKTTKKNTWVRDVPSNPHQSDSKSLPDEPGADWTVSRPASTP